MILANARVHIIWCKIQFASLSQLTVVLEGYCRCPDSHDLSECHHPYDLGRHTEQPFGICSCIMAAPGCQKSSPSYQFNSLNFDSKKLSGRSVEDHLKRTWFWVTLFEMSLFMVVMHCILAPLLQFCVLNFWLPLTVKQWVNLHSEKKKNPVSAYTENMWLRYTMVKI